MSDYFPVYLYLGMTLLVAAAVVGVSALFSSVRDTAEKFMPYESGIKTETELLKKRFPLHHYLVGLLFLVFDIEVIFLYPWAVVGKEIGIFAFYEMLFFIAAVLVGFIYIWRKRGLEWE